MTAPSSEVLGTTPQRTGTFDVSLAPEASGLVSGRRDPSVLWIVDDGPGTASLLAVDRAGTTLGVVEMAGVEGIDTEDLAIGSCGPQDPAPCLYVGDVGDNVAGRATVQVHRFPEPAPDAGRIEVTTATVTLPAAPTDVEGLVVTDDGIPVLLTKEEGRTRLLAPAAFADGPLVELAELELPVPERPLLTGFVGLTVTAADLAPSGSRLLLRTYDSVVELTAPPGDRDLAGVAGWTAIELPAPFEGQGEAVAYLPDGRGYATVSEGTGDIWVAERP